MDKVNEKMDRSANICTNGRYVEYVIEKSGKSILLLSGGTRGVEFRAKQVTEIS